MSAVNKRYFEDLLRDQQMSLRQLAHRMGVSHSQLSLTFSGSRNLKLQEAVQLASIFNEPLGRVIEAMGVPNQLGAGHPVSVIGHMDGEGVVKKNPPEAIERTVAPAGVPEDSFAIQARTAGTALDYLDGALWFARRQNGVEPASVGRLAVCQIKDGPLVLAGLRRGYLAGTHNLAGLHRAENCRLEWATPVLMARY